MILEIPATPENQIPSWFWYVVAIGSVSILATGFGWVLKYVLNKNKEEWTEMRNSVTSTSQSVKGVSDSVKDLVGTVRLHEFRINDNTDDIKDIQRQMNGHIVKYKDAEQ